MTLHTVLRPSEHKPIHSSQVELTLVETGTVLLESEQFLTELTRLFQKCSGFITLKKYDGRTKPTPRKSSVEGSEPTENKYLLRATDGKRKISTVVSSKEVSKFQMAYSNLLRANRDGLKKRDKKNKSKKTKSAQ
ncbi:signal recognition particle 14 kDa protein-like [Peromyscus californicus insignis]|uniref:signal recognition particle 14 kDa protein-like n=1 Tax=Peromyscus californicus insignis TaxID=564181 RepID=UPI0022A66F14|nr:signal recognition particle 14 kDa protein-like [Peromyscus californicus insignis]